MTTDPALLPEIAERSAEAAIAAHYAEIRTTLSLRTVPLLYRVMAPQPDCLAWAWARIGPLAASGVLAELGMAARKTVEQPSVAPPRAACRIAGLDNAAADACTAVVAALQPCQPDEPGRRDHDRCRAAYRAHATSRCHHRHSVAAATAAGTGNL